MDELQNNFKDISLDYGSCLQMWEHVGNQGNPELQYQLGNAYEEVGSSSYLANANEWYSKAIEYSHGPSLFRLGRLFELGFGATQDYEKAIELYNQSAMTGNNDALNALGNIYQQGNGVELDVAKAFGYYKNAAENGDSKAQFTLGTLYENEGVERTNLLEAFKWFSISASQGNEEARSHLELHYENIDSVGLFNTKSLHYLLKFLELEKSTSRPERAFFGGVYYQLGCMYYFGYGTPINYEKAWEYFKASHEKYSEDKAALFLNFNVKDHGFPTKVDYLKKLEMWESIVHIFKKEEVYELGLLYYHGVYEHFNASELCKISVVEPNGIKSTEYFKMVIDKELQGMCILWSFNK
jgi:TPR repeat protein